LSIRSSSLVFILLHHLAQRRKDIKLSITVNLFLKYFIFITVNEFRLQREAEGGSLSGGQGEFWKNLVERVHCIGASDSQRMS
jgi:hypothetical protein